MGFFCVQRGQWKLRGADAALVGGSHAIGIVFAVWVEKRCKRRCFGAVCVLASLGNGGELRVAYSRFFCPDALELVRGKVGAVDIFA